MNLDSKLIVLAMLLLLFALPAGAKSSADAQAQELYFEAVALKSKGAINESRKKAESAMRAAPESEFARMAEFLIRTQLPRDRNLPDRAISMDARGERLLQVGKTKEAKALFMRVIKEYPTFEWSYNNIGIIYMAENNFTAASTYLKQATRINPDYINAIHNLGISYERTGRHNEALDCARRVLRLDPADADALILRDLLVQKVQQVKPKARSGKVEEKRSGKI